MHINKRKKICLDYIMLKLMNNLFKLLKFYLSNELLQKINYSFIYYIVDPLFFFVFLKCIYAVNALFDKM